MRRNLHGSSNQLHRWKDTRNLKCVGDWYIPNTMNVIVKCGYPHWCKYALIRKDIKKMEVLV